MLYALPRLDGLTILLVEDNSDTREALTELLRELGATVVEAGDGTAALDAMRTAIPNVLISDLGLPGEHTGLTLLRAARGLAPELPAIAISGTIDEDSRAQALAAGFQFFMKKPVNFDDVIGHIRTLSGYRSSGF
jgi:CheY-like chemotaxis protein